MPKRTTLTLDDAVDSEIRRLALERGTSVKALTNEALRAGLAVLVQGEPAKRYRVKPASLGAPPPGLDLVKALALADELEDAELIARMRAAREPSADR